MDKPAQVVDILAAAAGGKPLRILGIVDLPWDARLGAPRVWIELAEEWRAAGHVVETYSLSDAFPGSAADRAKFALRRVLFPHKAAKFVKANAARFDVIDALIGTLPYSKAALGFTGLLVARSVGLYTLYDRFDEAAEKRWPPRARGKISGRVLYGALRRRLRRAAEASVEHADLLNLPNEEEADSVRSQFGRGKSLVVLPYGLGEARRLALQKAAEPARSRLAQKRVSFIGMWGPRKGSRDWSRIIRAIRRQVSDARFRFLGTMIDEQNVRLDLEAADCEGVEFISAYEPEQLPALLATCTAGAFPSYVEGFGLAVLEQLAAGLPTVAYDIAGPRDILARELPHCLSPAGDIDAFAARIAAILRLDPQAYGEWSTRSVEAAAPFSWGPIAEQTIATYRRCLGETSSDVVFVQPFSLASAGGGARILRALLKDAPFSWTSICSSPERPAASPNEIHLPSRPSWGRVEHTRLAMLPQLTSGIYAARFRRALTAACIAREAKAIHAVPHAGLDFAHAHAVARELSLPFFISVHDDLAYTAGRTLGNMAREAAMRSAWREADGRFVISDSLGQEYSRRYGDREYSIVTDGLARFGSLRSDGDEHQLRIYFMGLFHMAYEENFRRLLEGVELFERQSPTVRVSVICRCEHIRAEVSAGTKDVTILPFASEEQVAKDMESADVLYMPIPFGDEHGSFARFSLSTKMVTYAGSGLPILYHGPAEAAACDLLQQNGAAFPVTTLHPEEIAKALREVALPERRLEVARNALALARREFTLADQTRKFWTPFLRVLAPK